MHDMPQDVARDLDKDSYSAQTGKDPENLSSAIPGEEGVEAQIGQGRISDTDAAAQDADTTIRIAHERAESGGMGGQG